MLLSFRELTFAHVKQKAIKKMMWETNNFSGDGYLHVEPTDEGFYMAWAGDGFDLTAFGTTEEEAMGALEEKIDDCHRMLYGTEEAW